MSAWEAYQMQEVAQSALGSHEEKHREDVMHATRYSNWNKDERGAISSNALAQSDERKQHERRSVLWEDVKAGGAVPQDAGCPDVKAQQCCEMTAALLCRCFWGL